MASEVFRRIADDEKINEDTLPAIEKLIAVLRETEGIKPGERDYFDTLAEFIRAPFARALEQKRKKELASQKKQPKWFEKQENVDSLFEF